MPRHRATGRRPESGGPAALAIAGAAQHRPDPGVDLPWPERLDQVVVGSRIEGADDVSFVVSRRRDDDWHLAHRPEHPQGFIAVQARESQVEDDQVGWRSYNPLQRIEGARSAGHGVSALGQRAYERMADRRVVLHEQQLRHTADASRARHVAPANAAIY